MEVWEVTGDRANQGMPSVFNSFLGNVITHYVMARAALLPSKIRVLHL